MNHQKIYDNIIAKAKSENRKKCKKSDINYVYYDNHHIIPACIGGGDEKENMQLLTDKEHYVCHKLLTYIYKGNRKLACAFHKMTYSKNGNHIKSSRDYAYAKELMRNTLISEETRQKLSKATKGKSKSLEHRKKIGLKSKGRKHTEESREKQRKAQTGKKASK
jgi:NUMOD3 motif